MITEISVVAGEILTLLEEQHRPVSVTEIKFHLLGDSVDLLNMAMGWLIRENYVHCITNKEGEEYLIAKTAKTNTGNEVEGHVQET